MNLFQLVFLDVILLTFPIFIYLIYLSENKNIKSKSKKMYYKLALITSFFLLYNYGWNSPKNISLLVLNIIVILLYLEDCYISSNIISLSIVVLYSTYFSHTWIFFISYILIAIVYIVKKTFKLNNIFLLETTILINCVFYTYWIYRYNYTYFDLRKIILVIISYVFIANIIYQIYETGKSILETHFKFKELQQEKQIRLSLFKITHEIKNPIAVCKGYLDMMNINDAKQVSRYVPIIKSEIERLLSLLQDFLLINKSNLDVDIMDINMLIEDSIYKLKPILNENNIKLSLNILDDEIFIKGDYNRLSQVLINIIKNSVEAIPKGNCGNIVISSKVKNNKYFLTIEDNGIGMTKDILKKMKEPFFTTKLRGSGLGVSLIYEILEAHHTKIEYQSEPGIGTKAILQFPLLDEADNIN